MKQKPSECQLARRSGEVTSGLIALCKRNAKMADRKGKTLNIQYYRDLSSEYKNVKNYTHSLNKSREIKE
jgi:hypothetical protein